MGEPYLFFVFLNKKLRSLRILFFLILLQQHCLAQTKVVDSIRKMIAMADTNEEIIKTIFSLSNVSINPDTLYPYILEAERIAHLSKNDSLKDIAAYSRAIYYTKRNIVDSAMVITEILLSKYRDKPTLRNKYMDLLFFKSKIYDRGNQLSLAVTSLMDVIQEAENQKDTLILIQAKTGIGWVMTEMEQYADALKWLNDAKSTTTNQNYYHNYGALYSNMAIAFNGLSKEDSALYYINIAINDARQNENLGFLATALSIQAKIFLNHHKAYLAEEPLKEVVQIRKILNDPYYTVYDMSSLASYYANNNQPQKGIELCLEGIEIARKLNLQPQLLMIYRTLAENYKAQGNMAQYGRILEDIISLKDSFFKINTTKQIVEMEAGAKVQKNEKTILEQKLKITTKNYWLFAGSLIILTGGLIFWLIFSNYKRRQKLSLKLAIEEEKRNTEQSVHIAEEQERKRIAADLHDNLGAYASAIQADVDNIIQKQNKTQTQSLINLQQHSKEILTSLRDTIWVLNKDKITITGVSDRIKNYINRMVNSYPNINFTVEEKIEQERELSSQQALNIFRIVQEAIHNSIKHSKANIIAFTLKSNNEIYLSVSDNGVGISKNNHSGNGMDTMTNRAAESGILLNFESIINNGTVISLKICTTN